MSHAFIVTGVKQLSVSRVQSLLGIDDLRFNASSPQPVDDQWPDTFSYIYRDKVSVRSLEAEFVEAGWQLRIFACSSPQDYAFALKLLVVVAKISAGKIQPEDNEALSIPDFKKQYDRTWLEQHCKSMLQMNFAQLANKLPAQMEISGVNATMTLGETMLSELKNDRAGLAKAFFKRMKLLNFPDNANIHHAKIYALTQEGIALEYHFTSYTENVATLVRNDKTLVDIRTAEGPESDDNQLSGQLYVPLTTLKSLLGAKALWLSEDLLLLPQLAGAEWRALLAEAKAHQIEDPIAEYGVKTPEPTAAMDLPVNKESLLLLAQGPAVAFFMVAGADGKIDEKEITAFKNEVLEGLSSSCELFKAAAATLVLTFEDMMQQLIGGKVVPLMAMAQIDEVLRLHQDQQEADDFRESLYFLAKNIAEASGGILGRLGSKISKKEQLALNTMQVLLFMEVKYP